jgi:hypothetical protein
MYGMALYIILTVFGLIVGFIMGTVHAFLYNAFAVWVGGIRLEFQE